MKIRKNGVWEDYKYPIYESATDTITSLPTDIIADGSPLLAYRISGNLVQTGTPTPDNPIQPQEVGELVTTGEHSGEYVLPVLSGGVTTPIYLDEPLRKIGDYADKVEGDTVTRYIKKLVLTGEENWAIANNRFRLVVPDYLRIRDLLISKCNHYEAVPNGTAAADAGDNQLTFLASSSSSMYMYIGDVPHRGMLDDFKSFLAQQYANGTPVCVWYVLAEPTTEAITAPTIPTINGSQTFDVDTTLKPSEVQLTYKGWHKHSPKEYNNGSWT